MKSPIKIESGIPLPRKQRGKWNRVIDEMAEGDSIVLDKPRERIAILHSAKKMGAILTTRKEEDGKIRVWLVKRELRK